ncbi:phosphopantetheine-binding protein [Vaginella massiliensis]|uniref:phosphopantetheine-binding protein n=1 Tax=Vaginella massiliensis TaxID=1816680 RepID=UPI000838A177|nr:phosphopantetheine-binding protein [Vaginella massiliensis]
MENLINELRQKVVEVLNLEDINADEIDPKEPLFGEGLGLDSIDALELIVLMDKEFGIKITDPKQGKTIFESIETMAKYITENRTK